MVFCSVPCYSLGSVVFLVRHKTCEGAPYRRCIAREYGQAVAIPAGKAICAKLQGGRTDTTGTVTALCDKIVNFLATERLTIGDGAEIYEDSIDRDEGSFGYEVLFSR